MRRCLECDKPLRPSDKGALCSPCYFHIITSQDLPDPPPLQAPVLRGDSRG